MLETIGPSQCALDLTCDFYHLLINEASPEEKQRLLGPFRFARWTDRAHRAAIAQAIRASMILVGPVP